MENFSKVISFGKCLPENCVTNYDLEKLINTTDEWIVQRTGIKQRYWVHESQGTTDLAYEASKEAIENSGLNVKDIDMILFATITPDHYFPGSACFLQHRLGIKGIPAIDIKQQCSGFIYGLSMADLYIKSGQYKNILLVGAEIHSKGIDRTDRGRNVSVLFGDGAGAVVISRCDVNDRNSDPHILSSHLHSDGEFAKELWVAAPGMANGPELISKQELEDGLQFPYMNGRKVFTHAVKRMCEVILEGLKHNKLSIEDIDFFAFHQANLRINDMVAKELQIPAEKVFNTIQKYGNTTAATIPLGLYDAHKEGVLRPGMLVGSAAFGSGFTWGSSFFRL